MNKYVVIFRAKGPIENIALEKKLADHDFKTITFPILNIKKIKNKCINTSLATAVLITSQFGLYYFSKLTEDRKIKLFLLGDSSKELAIKLGFKNIIDCQGDSVKMLKEIKKSIKKDEGELIYAGAKKISKDLPSLLTSYGYKVNRLVLYESLYVQKLSKRFLELMKNQQISWIILLSNKGARNFLRLSKFEINEKKNNFIKFCCLSSNIADELIISNLNKFFPFSPTIENICDLIINHEAKNG